MLFFFSSVQSSTRRPDISIPSLRLFFLPFPTSTTTDCWSFLLLKPVHIFPASSFAIAKSSTKPPLAYHRTICHSLTSVKLICFSPSWFFFLSFEFLGNLIYNLTVSLLLFSHILALKSLSSKRYFSGSSILLSSVFFTCSWSLYERKCNEDYKTCMMIFDSIVRGIRRIWGKTM